MATPARAQAPARQGSSVVGRLPVLRLVAGPRGEVELVGDLLAKAARRWPESTVLQRADAETDHPLTYGELEAEVQAVAAGFLGAGLHPGDRVALFADNRREWLVADQALARAGLISVPRGVDSAPQELDLIVAHSGARGIVAENTALVDGLSRAARERPIWLLQHERGTVFQSLAGLAGEGRALLEGPGGRELLENARALVTPDSPCTIVYTSGTTGRPKGVVLSHHNVTSNVRAANTVLNFFPGGRLLSILPPWHMFERIIEYVAISNGCTVIYTHQRRLKRDMEHEAPHCVAFVPRLWEVLAAGLRARLDELPGWKKHVLDAFRELGEAIAAGEGNAVSRWLHRRLSRILLRPLWTAFGGNLALGVSGGGALPEEVDRFLLSLGIPLQQGYGLTETSPVVSVRRAAENRVRSVGPPLPDTEVRIAGPDGDRAAGAVGEILIRGPQVMQGYYKDEELTRQVIDPDGWLRTGDLGWLDADGWIYITGRAKDTIVLSTGENVEPEPIECRLRASRYIEQVMLVGQDQRVVGALLVPDSEALAERLGGADETSVQRLLRREMDRLLARESGFRPVDRPGPFAVLAEPFTRENGALTPTLKLRRHVIAQQHADTIRALYDRGP